MWNEELFDIPYLYNNYDLPIQVGLVVSWSTENNINRHKTNKAFI